VAPLRSWRLCESPPQTLKRTRRIDHPAAAAVGRHHNSAAAGCEGLHQRGDHFCRDTRLIAQDNHHTIALPSRRTKAATNGAEHLAFRFRVGDQFHGLAGSSEAILGRQAPEKNNLFSFDGVGTRPGRLPS
jgi:hypothetical protein